MSRPWWTYNVSALFLWCLIRIVDVAFDIANDAAQWWSWRTTYWPTICLATPPFWLIALYYLTPKSKRPGLVQRWRRVGTNQEQL